MLNAHMSTPHVVNDGIHFTFYITLMYYLVFNKNFGLINVVVFKFAIIFM